MRGGSGERGDHDEAIAIGGVHQGLRHRPTTSGAGHRQEQHGHMGELPAHLPLIRAEFTNHALALIMASAIPATPVLGGNTSLTEDMGIWGYAHYSEWPKVADEVIEAHALIEFMPFRHIASCGR